jgi:hypothetical protein
MKITYYLILLALLFIVLNVYLYIDFNKEGFDKIGDMVRPFIFMEFDYPAVGYPDVPLDGVPVIPTTRSPLYKPVSFELEADGKVPDEAIRQMLIGEGKINPDDPLPSDSKSRGYIRELKEKAEDGAKDAVLYPPAPRKIPTIDMPEPSNLNDLPPEERAAVINESNEKAYAIAMEIMEAQKKEDAKYLTPLPFMQFYSS